MGTIITFTRIHVSGPNDGVDLDYVANGPWTVGAEYIQRTLQAGFKENPNAIEVDCGMVQLRAFYTLNFTQSYDLKRGTQPAPNSYSDYFRPHLT
ncbi:hypothetical protein DS901_15290 [Loktanella sp. D2R18]|nr:hypothetical protein DS901_15290 [Loktanella sp. D2R18]